MQSNNPLCNSLLLKEHKTRPKPAKNICWEIEQYELNPEFSESIAEIEVGDLKAMNNVLVFATLVFLKNMETTALVQTDFT